MVLPVGWWEWGMATLKPDCRIQHSEIHLEHLRMAVISDSNNRATPTRTPNCLSQHGIGLAWVLEGNVRFQGKDTQKTLSENKIWLCTLSHTNMGLNI